MIILTRIKSSRCRPKGWLVLAAWLGVVALSMSLEVAKPALAQEAQETQIAELKEKLQRESRSLKRHIAELLESGRTEDAEATQRELSEFQHAMEQRIREVRGDRPIELERVAKQKRMEAQNKRVESQQKRAEAEQRAPNEDEVHRQELDKQLRHLHEQLTMAIKKRQPDAVVQISHQIANHLREHQVREEPRREEPRREKPRREEFEGRRDPDRGHPGPDGPRPRHSEPRQHEPGQDFTREMRMMVQELRGELQQLRRELEELRRERH